MSAESASVGGGPNRDDSWGYPTTKIGAGALLLEGAPAIAPARFAAPIELSLLVGGMCAPARSN